MSRAVVPFRQDQQPEAEAPPHNEAIEQALLGALMVWPAALERVAATLLPEHFFFGAHAVIYTVITRLAAAGIATTAPAIRGYLPMAEIAGQPAMAYLAHLGTEAGVLANVEGHMLDELHGSYLFTKIDLKYGYP